MKKQLDPTDVLVGSRIRYYRKAQNVRQIDLAVVCGTTHQQVQKYEAGKTPVPPSRLHQIAKALKVPIGTFFAEEEPEWHKRYPLSREIISLLVRYESMNEAQRERLEWSIIRIQRTPQRKLVRR